VAALLELNGDLANTRWFATDADTTANPFDFKKTFDAYTSWQLAKPGSQNQATDPATITVPEGFKSELIRSAQPGEDSWISMSFDPQGRILLGKSMIRGEKNLRSLSPMSAGLLNSLKLEQILDLLAWFEAQGDAGHAVFQK
jgi:hypothetical protein